MAPLTASNRVGDRESERKGAHDSRLDSIANAPSARLFAFCAIGFLVLLVVGTALIAPHNKLPGRGDAPLPIETLPNMPVLQIELARKEDDLVDVLTKGNLSHNLEVLPTENQSRNFKDARIGNDLDTFLFIPAYAGLRMSLGLMRARGDEQWRVLLLLAALVAAPMAVGCDWAENAGISATLHHFEEPGHIPHPGDALRISTPSFIKWMTLAAVLLIYGIAGFRQIRKQSWALAGTAVIAVAGTGLGAVLLYTLIQYGWKRWGP